MYSKNESIYLSLPPFLQNTAISLYGIKIIKIRHGHYFQKTYNKINKNYSMDESEIERYQIEKIKKMIKLCQNHVPYYKKILKNINIKRIDSLNVLNDIPILEKIDIKREANKFINDRFNHKRLVKVHTTGTTGTPLNIYCDEGVRQKNYAFYARYLNSVGINYKGKRVTFGGRILMNIEINTPPFWRYSIFQKNLLMSSYHLHEKFLPRYIKKLKEFKPDYIDAYPSSLYIISNFADKNNISLKNITKGITTSAETLYKEQRVSIENAFGLKISDQYGAAEMCFFAGQCRNGKYHIHQDYGIMEVVDKKNQIVKNGEEGEFICTGFINPIMPLLRYRIGDRGNIIKESCNCGCRFPIIGKLLGRIDDFIQTPEGKKVGRLSPVLKGFPVIEAQYIQVKVSLLTVRIVKDKGYNQETEKRITVELRKRIGNTIKIQYEYFNKIPRSKGAKLRSIISNVN